ncbi:ATP-dependent helicase [Kamptonema formosum]|uniref:ATP-dependent helicase n=1 Tax=Kamptonema formosum TaxID=331992 RepID=UPI00034BB03F|nr:ATP-dependent DNA helicase [Oscillatoria sp. PCC 10802]
MSLNYTDEQEQAIAHRQGNLLIIACAGSGKTEVISRRIAEIVDEGVPRSSIIAFTFTDRAARELKARIRGHLEDINPDDPSLGDMYVGTIHSFCLQLLKEIDPLYRYFEVMDDVRQAALIAANYHYYPDSGRGIGLNNLRSKTKRKGYWESAEWFMTTLNVIHLKGIREENIHDAALRDAVLRYKEIANDRPNYFFDFNTIIAKLLESLNSKPAELEKVRSKFRYLIVDEYQDVDPRQEELIHLLSDGGQRMSVCVVGDDDQAIYGWRGADINNILTFEQRYPNVTRVELVNNFRSTHAIVEIANAAVRRLPPTRRLHKAMVARFWEPGQRTPILRERMAEQGDIHRQAFASDEAEAAWVAKRIKDLRGTVIEEKDGTERAIDYADMAILLRSVRSSGQVFVDTLRAENIPVVVKGTRGLFSHDEVLLAQAAFCQLAQEDFYYTDMAGELHRYSANDTREFIRHTVCGLREQQLMPHADASLFLGWIAEKREDLKRRSLPQEERGGISRRIYPQHLFHEMLQQLGAGQDANPWPESVLYNLGRFSHLLTQFESVKQWVTPNDLTSLCRFLSGWAAGKTDDGGADEITTPNAVQIMTVHAAKGLEWPVVFVPRVSSANFPSSLRNRGPETFLKAQEFDPGEYAGGDEGERRLWYVALTRCRKFLHISSQDRKGKKPTGFYTEIRHDFVRGDGIDPTARKRSQPTPPVETELLPTTFSDLNYYWKCPFDYQLRRLMGFSPAVEHAFGYGKQIHNLLAEIHQRAYQELPITEEFVRNLVDQRFNLRYTLGQHFEELKDAAKRCILRYIDEYPQHVELALEAEKPFEYVDRKSGALISGTIDLLERVYFDESSGEVRTPVCIVDFKSQKWDTVESYIERRNDVERQLRLYAAAVRHALGFDPDNGAHAHFLSPKRPDDELVARGVAERFTVDVGDEYQEQVREEVRTAVDGIKSGNFPMTGCQTGRCQKCDFQRICPAGFRKS